MKHEDQSNDAKSPTYPADHDNRGTKPPQEMTPEQQREAQESREARNAQASIRDRMVDIGRGDQQAGRHGHPH